VTDSRSGVADSIEQHMVNKDKPGWPEQVLSGQLKPAEYAGPTVIGRAAEDTGLGWGPG
jgi:hypothetical protein